MKMHLLAAVTSVAISTTVMAQGAEFETGISLRNGSGMSLFDTAGHSTTVTTQALTANLFFKLPASAGTAGQVLATDGAGTLSWVNQYSLPCLKTDWATADGSSKQFVHGLGTKDVSVTVFDGGNGHTLLVDEVRSDNDNVILTANEAPGGSGWRVLICAL